MQVARPRSTRAVHGGAPVLPFTRSYLRVRACARSRTGVQPKSRAHVRVASRHVTYTRAGALGRLLHLAAAAAPTNALANGLAHATCALATTAVAVAAGLRRTSKAAGHCEGPNIRVFVEIECGFPPLAPHRAAFVSAAARAASVSAAARAASRAPLSSAQSTYDAGRPTIDR